jgi:hypothetical protein
MKRVEEEQERARADEALKEKMRRDAIANESRALANESRALTALSQAARLRGNYTDAVKLALAAWPRSVLGERPQLSQTIDALGQALAGPLDVSVPLRHEGSLGSAA